MELPMKRPIVPVRTVTEDEDDALLIPSALVQLDESNIVAVDENADANADAIIADDPTNDGVESSAVVCTITSCGNILQSILQSSSSLTTEDKLLPQTEAYPISLDE